MDEPVQAPVDCTVLRNKLRPFEGLGLGLVQNLRSANFALRSAKFKAGPFLYFSFCLIRLISMRISGPIMNIERPPSSSGIRGRLYARAQSLLGFYRGTPTDAQSSRVVIGPQGKVVPFLNMVYRLAIFL